MRKKISLLMAAVLCCGTILAGCSNTESTGTQSSSAAQENAAEESIVQGIQEEQEGQQSALDTSEFVTLYGYLLGSPEPAFNEVMDEMNKMLKEDLNCEMEINFIDWGVLDSKYPLLLAAGEEIDWIYTADWCHYAAEANKNAFMEIDLDMVKRCMPMYSEYIADAAWDQVTLNDKIYMIPTSTPDVKAYGWIIRKDLADKYGVDLSKVETIWDMDEYLGAIKENEPSMIPMNMDNSYDLLAPIFALMTAKDAGFSDSNKCGLVYAFDGNETADGVYSIFEEPVYSYLKEAAVKMKEIKISLRQQHRAMIILNREFQEFLMIILLACKGRLPNVLKMAGFRRLCLRMTQMAMQPGVPIRIMALPLQQPVRIRKEHWRLWI